MASSKCNIAFLEGYNLQLLITSSVNCDNQQGTGVGFVSVLTEMDAGATPGPTVAHPAHQPPPRRQQQTQTQLQQFQGPPFRDSRSTERNNSDNKVCRRTRNVQQRNLLWHVKGTSIPPETGSLASGILSGTRRRRVQSSAQ